ncbi:MAG: MATE family efflux transporter [Clostridiales bacterium]|nr:MATE family efflux transporter [Clostridiales bacterium]
MDMFYKIKNLKQINENDKSLLYNVGGAFFVKGVAMIVSLLTLPAYIRYFGDNTVLGVWYTILSVITNVITFDLGIGNGLRNHLVVAFVKKDNWLAKQYISAAYFVNGLICLIGIVLSIAVVPNLKWNQFLNIKEEIVSTNILSTAMEIVCVGIMIQLFLKLITSVLYAMQKSAIINLINLISNTMIMVYVMFSPSETAEINIIKMSYFNVLAVNLPLLIVNVALFAGKMKKMRPSIYAFKNSYAVKIMKLGGAFFWVQIVYMLVISTNEFFITWLASPQEVVQFQIYNKLYGLIGTISLLALTPVWSIVTKAMIEQDSAWIKKLNRKLYRLAILATIAEILLIPLSRFIIPIWINDSSVTVKIEYVIVFAIYGSAMIWNSVLSSVANGMGKPQLQAIIFTIALIIKYPISKVLVNQTNSWIGVVIATIIPLIVYSVLQLYINRKYLENIKINKL